ncbi:cytochrome P450 3A14-like isoform X3 [Haemaphysalis longicornis]
MFVATLLVFLSVFLVTAVLLWRKRHFSYFKKLGIPGPEPNLICGNLLEYHSSESYKVIGWWLKKYGNIFGFSNGDVPFVVINDLDFIEYVYVRNFGNFANRGLNMMTDLMHPILGKSLLLARGTNARNIRSCLSYALSSAKLKKMIAGFEEDADIFVKSLDPYAETGEEVHMLEKLEGLAMDYVARGSFGLEERFQGKPDHPFLTVAKKAFRGVMKGPFHWIAQSTTTLGELMRPFYWLCFTFGEFTFLDMTVHTEKIVDMRRKDPSLRRPDLLQNLIDAEYVESSNVEEDTPRPTGFFKSKTLTNDEITTTATSVVLGGSVTRQAKEDFEFHGIKFKAGTCFMVPTYQLHRDPRFWPSPEIFDPDRFSPEHGTSLKKLAYAVFGIGPRNCVGMRFTILELKYTIARLVQKYHLELGASQMSTTDIGGISQERQKETETEEDKRRISVVKRIHLTSTGHRDLQEPTPAPLPYGGSVSAYLAGRVAGPVPCS